MSKLNEIKKALGKILFNFDEAVVGDITYVFEKLEVGEPIFIYNEEGEKVPADDATFEYDGNTIVIKDGLIESIKPIESEEEETPADVELEEEEEEAPADEPDKVAELEARVTDLELRLEVTINTVNELVSIMNDTVVAVDEFAKKPVAEKITNKFSTEKSNEKKIGAKKYFQ